MLTVNPSTILNFKLDSHVHIYLFSDAFIFELLDIRIDI